MSKLSFRRRTGHWSGGLTIGIYVERRNAILMGWRRLCLCMFTDKQAVGVQVGEDVVQEPVHEYQDTWCN